MAQLDFPASPSINQEFTGNGITYTWTGTHWEADGGSGGSGGTTDLYGTAAAWGNVERNGTLKGGRNCTVSRTALGRYSVVFDTPMTNDNYSVTYGTVYNSEPTLGGYSDTLSKTSTGFTVGTNAVTDGQMNDYEFCFAVFDDKPVTVSGGGGSSTTTIGAIVAWPNAAVPTGWLECDGSAIPSQYTELIALVGANTPDLRGEFIRGWDNGAGVDIGRALLTAQGDSTALPNSAFGTSNPGNHTHTYQLGIGSDPQNQAPTADPVSKIGTGNTGGGGSHTHTITGGDSETRPRNVALMYIINADGSSIGGGGGGNFVKIPGDTMTGNLTIPSLNNGPLAGFRNILINGDLTINQRDKTYSAAANNEYWADRWKKVSGGMTQTVEEANFIPNTQYTLSGINVPTQQLTSPGSGHWTIPTVPSNAENIQLEIGPVATPFEFRHSSLEYSLCQRYYEVGQFVSFAGTVHTNGDSRGNLIKLTPKRAGPTIGKADGSRWQELIFAVGSNGSAVNLTTEFDIHVCPTAWVIGNLANITNIFNAVGGGDVIAYGSNSTARWYADAEIN